MNFSRPSARRSVPSLASCRSTIIWVAMPAWSVPGIHKASCPRMRRQRMMMSISVWLSMWPMCSRPVTLGGGSNSAKARAASGEPGGGVRTENSFSCAHFSAQRGSMALGS